jgi:SAM-dependent methyltransferase
MDPSTQEKLLAINQNFYDIFADSFSTTRHQVQPGVRKLIDKMIDANTILDVGCGNGTLARALAENDYKGIYLGGDMSRDLLSNAEEMLGDPSQGEFKFFIIDLANPGWHQSLPIHSFDWLVSFAVLHHIPGKELRQEIVQAFSSLLTPKSRVALSVWQWQNSPRLRKRVLPWSRVGLSNEAVDEGDVLLDWRAGETIGLRYVHTYSDKELAALGEHAGFTVIDSFYSDGKTGNLALYQIWQLD